MTGANLPADIRFAIWTASSFTTEKAARKWLAALAIAFNVILLPMPNCSLRWKVIFHANVAALAIAFAH
jgi:hypothetical protein